MNHASVLSSQEQHFDDKSVAIHMAGERDDDDFWLIDDLPEPREPIPSQTPDLLTEAHPENPFEPDLEDPFNDVNEVHELQDLDATGHVAGSRLFGEYNEPGKDDRRFDIRRLWQWISRSRGQPSLPFRTVLLNDFANQGRFARNSISTTKYNIATFLPKFLFEQFSKYSNLFFLATAIIQQVPNVTPTNRFTTIGTLIVVLLVSASKELVEDWKRRVSDGELNNSRVKVLDPSRSSFVSKRWVKVRVGDIVQVDSEQQVPADLVLISSSEPEGLCYVETSNLDGETNLKIKQSLPVSSKLRNPEQLSEVRGRIESEHPNSSLYTYEGTLVIEGEKRMPLSPDQMILRGTFLRNTQHIYGVAVFTGHETKLMRNATATPIKRTAVEHMINLQIIFLFLILIVMTVLSSLGNVIRQNTDRNKAWYLSLSSTSAASTFFLDILTFWILFSNLVPISLFVTVEVIKYYQAFLISSDIEMYDASSDTPAICRTSSLVEELGQIQYIFSDKTGTLTRNVMEFKACHVAGKTYSWDIPEDHRGEWIDFKQIDHQDPSVSDLLFLLSACHTVIPERLEDDRIKYQASSPDEGALVEGAAGLDWRFIARKPRGIVVSLPDGTEQEYELLNICEFNSTRKRMSTIFRLPNGSIRILTKGADTVIFERLRTDVPEDIVASLESFAGEGLRTLCLAQREISQKEYQNWVKSFDEAAISLDNRSDKIDAAAELIEKDLEFVGVTAIEDKLQEGVPDTIHALQDAGIKIWVLTGDRQETAINIGMSCKLLSEDMNLLVVNETTVSEVHSNIQQKLDTVTAAENTRADLDSLALVIDGVSLGLSLTPEVEKDFLDLAVICKAVICCRVSPLQKALVVKLVKRHLKALLLAIGDGANDVSMIQAAHVGVGISGMEGQQAARSADVAIGQFRFLRKLLLVHGSWSYNRLSRAILFSFYKNIALYITQFWYVFFNGFSGETLYESWILTAFNVLVTMLAPFVIGIFDQFVSARLLNRYPKLYRLGQDGVFLSVSQFWQWIANGIYHSLIIFFFSYGAYKSGNVLPNGRIQNQWAWGVVMYTTCCITVLGKAALVTNMWNRYTIIAIPGSLAFWLGLYPPYSLVAPLTNISGELRGTLAATYPTVMFWALNLLIPATCLARDIGWKYYRRMYMPEYYHYIQEIQKYNINDTQPRVGQFQRAIRKVRQVQRMRKQRGFAFSQPDTGAERVVRAYDTTKPY